LLRGRIGAIAAGREKMDSIRTCYYSGSSVQPAGNGDLFSSERAIPGGMEVPAAPPGAGRGAFARPAPAGVERQGNPYRLQINGLRGEDLARFGLASGTGPEQDYGCIESVE